MRTNRGTGARRSARALLIPLLLAAALIAGCAAAPAASDSPGPTPARTPVRVAALKGPTGVGMVGLMKAQQDGRTANDYTFAVTDSPEDVVAKVASGDVDIAAVPTNLAATLYAKTSGGVRMLAVNTLGVMYVVENGDSVRGLADLAGKTIHATGQGSNPEYVLRFLLERAGLDPDKDVKIVFASEHDELATLVADGRAKIALLPEPFVTTVTTKSPKVRVALDLTAEWARTVTDGSQLMMGGVIARSEFAEQSPQAITDFLAEYRASVNLALTDADGTATLCEQFGVIPSAAVAKRALPRLGLTYLDGDAMRAGLQGYFQVLYDANPKSVGGALPDSGFYFTTK